MAGRRQLSREALERAVRARLAAELGVEAACVVVPVRVLEAPRPDKKTSNWAVTTVGVEASCLEALERAAAEVARTTDLQEQGDPLKESVMRAGRRGYRSPRDPDL